jgi:hypothetical protein
MAVEHVEHAQDEIDSYGPSFGGGGAGQEVVQVSEPKLTWEFTLETQISVK